MIAVDGTKLAANAAPQVTRDYEQIAREIFAEADAIDAEKDAQFGDDRGDELPPELSTAQGRRGSLREAKKRLDERRAEEARPIARDRPDRLREAKRRLEEEHQTECRANAAYEAYRAAASIRTARSSAGRPSRFSRRRRRSARSISVTWIRATSRPRVAGFRATTPKQSHRRSDRHRRRSDRRLAGLRAPRTDDSRRRR